MEEDNILSFNMNSRHKISSRIRDAKKSSCEHVMSIHCTPWECPFMSRIHETDSCLEFV